MSGIEIAGLVLGSFPIILNCLEYYREGFEPLEEWWYFRTHFMAFTDDISHQMMRYHENMIRLLDPVIADNASLSALVQHPKDPRWTDDSLTEALEHRLASEHGRFLRIIQRMEEDIENLKKFIGIKNGNVNWIRTEEQRPWEWHMKRFQISFSKGKAKKVKRLAIRNQELQEILGYSERIVPIADKRKSSEPVAIFEKICQHACAMHNALMRNWKCSRRSCRTHQANLCLQAETRSVSFNVLFILEDEGEGHSPASRKHEMTVEPMKLVETPLSLSEQFSHVKQAQSFTVVQKHFDKTKVDVKKSRFKRLFDKSSKSAKFSDSPKEKKHSPVVVEPPAITISQVHTNSQGTFTSTSATKSNMPFERVSDLCSSLRHCPNTNVGIIDDEYDRHFQIFKPSRPSPIAAAPASAKLTPLPALLDAHYQSRIELARHRRFEMALHIASALLQIQTSPWLDSRWSKGHIFFLADTRYVYSDYPYVSQDFVPAAQEPGQIDTGPGPSPSISEEETRASLFTVGVIILELIFGHNIEACPFRQSYYGPNNQPNDQTDVSTARKWSEKVLGECGVEIADVVRRCLYCSFGPRPNLKEKRFKEAIYEGVIRPLADYLKIWQPVVP